MKIIGIYKITNPVGKIYIGQSIDICNRFKQYRSLQCKKQLKIYNSLVKYKASGHKFEILQQCNPEELNELEKYYIALYNCCDSIYGLNIQNGGNSNYQISEDTRKRLSDAKKGEKNNRWGLVLSKETKNKISKAHKGKTLTQEHKKKLSQAKIGMIFSDEHRRNLSKLRTGHCLSDETKKKISESHKGEKCYMFGKTLSKESKDKMIRALKGRRLSEQHRLNIKKSWEIRRNNEKKVG